MKNLIIVLVVGFVAWVGYGMLKPETEEDRINKQMMALAEAIEVDGNESLLDAASKVGDLKKFFVKELVIEIDVDRQFKRRITIRDWNELKQSLLLVPRQFNELKLRFEDVSISDIEAQTAVSRTTAVARFQMRTDPQRYEEYIELELHWKKQDGLWLIEKIRSVAAIQQ
jgi:hypothetical protein